MNSETKNCQNCKKDFIIEADDFSFYEKIKVPPPTFCPECRLIRVMIWRNFRSLFKRKCGMCDKNLISMYPENTTKKVYCADCWYGDKRDPSLQGRDYDFSKPFFEQINQLIKDSPFMYAFQMRNVNSEFTNYIVDSKDCYLSFSILNGESVYYSELTDYSKNILDCYGSLKLENSYWNVNCESNYNCFYMIDSSKCIDSTFLFDCSNCQNCCLSSNLRNQQYVFKNKKLTKEEYEKAIGNLCLETYSGFKKAEEYFDDLFKNKSIHRYAQIYHSENATGDYIKSSRNIKNSFDVKNSENIFNSSRIIENVKDSYDNVGVAFGELIYSSVATSFNVFKSYFCYISHDLKNCEYLLNCKNCSNCFACVGLLNSEYCIFNKKYYKEEYEKLIVQIKKHMNEMPFTDRLGNIYKYGEFYPPEMTPFAYNFSTAHDFLPMNKEDIIKKGYPWGVIEDKNYSITLKSEDLPDSINRVDDLILGEIISCPNKGDENFQCSFAFKITPYELKFYKKNKLPIPRYCQNCRHRQRLRFRNPIKLHHRTCMKEGCNNEFETSYAPDRPEIVYCEKCYQQEVY